MRTCTCCNEVKPLTDFYHKTKRGTYEARCKSCFRAKVKAYADANREAVRESNRVAGEKFRAANRAQERARARAAYHADKERYAERSRVWRKAKPHLHAAEEAKRRASKAKATPSWANPTAIKAIYAEAARLSRESDVLMHVDHIVPLISDVVCGLHCEANLQILPAEANLQKGNRLMEALVTNPH